MILPKDTNEPLLEKPGTQDPARGRGRNADRQIDAATVEQGNRVITAAIIPDLDINSGAFSSSSDRRRGNMTEPACAETAMEKDMVDLSGSKPCVNCNVR